MSGIIDGVSKIHKVSDGSCPTLKKKPFFPLLYFYNPGK